MRLLTSPWVMPRPPGCARYIRFAGGEEGRARIPDRRGVRQRDCRPRGGFIYVMSHWTSLYAHSSYREVLADCMEGMLASRGTLRDRQGGGKSGISQGAHAAVGKPVRRSSNLHDDVVKPIAVVRPGDWCYRL